MPNFTDYEVVMPGLDPGIHPLRKSLCEGNGLPGQARQ
jgi:hypothetical protein